MPFIPTITDADIDAYLSESSHPTDEGNPCNGFHDSPMDIAHVLTFLGWVAELKAMTASPSDPGYFGYETMLYQYHKVADEIASLW